MSELLPPPPPPRQCHGYDSSPSDNNLWTICVNLARICHQVGQKVLPTDRVFFMILLSTFGKTGEKITFSRRHAATGLAVLIINNKDH